MQRVDFHRSKIQVVNDLGGVHEIVHRLAGEPDNHVGRDRKSCCLAALHRIFKFGKRVPAVDSRKRQVVCRLEPDFNDDGLFAVEFREIFHLVVFETVRTRANRKPCNFWVLDNRVDDVLQMFKRRVRIRVRLQVGEDACIRVLVAKFRNKFFKLLLNGNLRLVKDRAKAAVVAVAASRESLGAVEVRSTHAAVQRELAHLEVVGEKFQK